LQLTNLHEKKPGNKETVCTVFACYRLILEKTTTSMLLFSKDDILEPSWQRIKTK
jgi:hypothetical protein